MPDADPRPVLAAAAAAVRQLTERTTALASSVLRATAVTDVFSTALGRVQGAVASFVRLADPGAFARFNLAADRFTAAVGRAMAPLLENVTVVFDRLAAGVTAFGPAGKQLVAGLAAVAVGAGVAAAATLLLKTAVDVATGGFTAILSAAGGLAAAAGAFAFVAAPAGAVRGVVDKLSGAFAALADVAGEALGAVADALSPAFDALTDAVAGLARAAQPVVRGVAALAAAVFAPLADYLRTVGATVVPLVAELANAFGLLTAGLAPVLRDLGGSLAGAAKATITAVTTGLRDLLPSLTLLGEMFVTGLKAAIDTLVIPAVNALADALRDATPLLAGLAARVIDFAETTANALADMINRVNRGLRELTEFDPLARAQREFIRATTGVDPLGAVGRVNLDPLRDKLAQIQDALGRPAGAARDVAGVQAPNAVGSAQSGGLAEFFRRAQEASFKQALGSPEKTAERQREEQIRKLGEIAGAVNALAVAGQPPGRNLQFAAPR